MKVKIPNFNIQAPGKLQDPMFKHLAVGHQEPVDRIVCAARRAGTDAPYHRTGDRLVSRFDYEDENDPPSSDYGAAGDDPSLLRFDATRDEEELKHAPDLPLRRAAF